MSPPVKVYVIRIWYEPSAEGEVWRASAGRGEEQHYFGCPEDLVMFLSRQAQQSLCMLNCDP